MVWLVGVTGGTLVLAVLIALAPPKPGYGGRNDGLYAGTGVEQARCLQQAFAARPAGGAFETNRDLGERCRRAGSGRS